MIVGEVPKDDAGEIKSESVVKKDNLKDHIQPCDFTFRRQWRKKKATCFTTYIT